MTLKRSPKNNHFFVKYPTPSGPTPLCVTKNKKVVNFFLASLARDASFRLESRLTYLFHYCQRHSKSTIMSSDIMREYKSQ